MKFIGNIRLFFENEEIPLVVLEKFRADWSKLSLQPGIFGSEWSNRRVALSLLCQKLPFDIVADDLAGQLMLQIELSRFPYSINDRKGFEAFSLRLVPVKGRIALIQKDTESHIAIDTFVFSEEALFSNVGNGSVYVVIYRGRQPRKLPALCPPDGYQPAVVFDATNPAGF